MSTAVLATDADWLHAEVEAALGGDHTVMRVHEGAEVAATCDEVDADLILLDMQVGNMGGMATSMLLAQEMRAGRLGEAPIVLLLDREQDTWLASQADADAWLIKPLDSFRLRRAAQSVLAGEPVHEGPRAAVAEMTTDTGPDDAETADA